MSVNVKFICTRCETGQENLARGETGQENLARGETGQENLARGETGQENHARDSLFTPVSIACINNKYYICQQCMDIVC